jgi:N-acyl-D-aspartate/D-glutamate deacylase
VPERIAKLRDPEVRRMMNERAHSPDAGVFSRLAGWGRYRIGDTFSAENEGLKGRLVEDVARERGQSTFDTLLDIVIADELRTVLWPLPPDDDDESWHLRSMAWSHPHVMLGGSDAGAHLDRMSGAQYPTAFIADALRGRRLLSLEQAVHLLTDVPARLFGLRDRGRVAEGAWADLVIIDPDDVGAGETRMVHDLPGGSARLFTDATGVEAVFVNGRAVLVAGEATGAQPGRVLRSGRDTETVAIPATAAPE